MSLPASEFIPPKMKKRSISQPKRHPQSQSQSQFQFQFQFLTTTTMTMTPHTSFLSIGAFQSVVRRLARER